MKNSPAEWAYYDMNTDIFQVMVSATGLVALAPAMPVPAMLLRSGKVVVPATGLEPARLAAYAPKAYVYTNFTTRA